MTQCTGKTRKGTRCRRQALHDSIPPHCHHHRPGFERDEFLHDAASILDSPAYSEPRDLTAELRLVRDVLSRLADRLDDPDYTLQPADMRTLAMLIFSGVRTVAYLLSQEESESDELQLWLDQTLDKLSATMSAELSWSEDDG